MQGMHGAASMAPAAQSGGGVHSPSSLWCCSLLTCDLLPRDARKAGLAQRIGKAHQLEQWVEGEVRAGECSELLPMCGKQQPQVMQPGRGPQCLCQLRRCPHAFHLLAVFLRESETQKARTAALHPPYMYG